MRILGVEPYLTANGLNLTSLLIFAAILGFGGSLGGCAAGAGFAFGADDNVNGAAGAGFEGDDAAAGELDVVGMRTERDKRPEGGSRLRLWVL